MSERKSIPSKIEREILFRNEAACCICGKSNIQIHHIDGKHSNNSVKNLAVLCIEHHDQASSMTSMTRHLNPSLIRTFKLDWEARVSRKRQIVRRRTIAKTEEQSFVKFEIKRLVYSLPAFPDKKTTKSTIDQLYSWHLFSASTKDILNAFSYIRWFLKESQVAILLDRLWEFFWQFVDPKDVPMRKEDEKELLIAIELIGDLGKQMIIIEEHPRVFKYLFSAMKHFEEIASWYKKPLLKKAIKKQFIGIKKELVDSRKYLQRKILITKIERKLKEL